MFNITGDIWQASDSQKPRNRAPVASCVPAFSTMRSTPRPIAPPVVWHPGDTLELRARRPRWSLAEAATAISLGSVLGSVLEFLRSATSFQNQENQDSHRCPKA